MPVPPEFEPGCGAKLLTTDVMPCRAGVLGDAGVAFDTILTGYNIVLPEGDGARLVVTGIDDEPWLFDQRITLDGHFWFPFGVINKHGPLTFQASKAGVIWVFTRPNLQVRRS